MTGLATTRGARLGVALGICLAAGVAALWVAVGATTTPEEVAAHAAAPMPSLITVPVRVERLAERQQLPCTVAPRSRADVAVRVAPDVGDAIVTALPLLPGADVTEGSVVLEVSGRPVFAISGELPTYRDLAVGSSGPDVVQLQQALKRLGLLDASLTEGTLGAETAQAVVRLYEAAGYVPLPSAVASGASLPSDDSIRVPREELAPIRELPAVVGPLSIARGSPGDGGAIPIQSRDLVARCEVLPEAMQAVLAASGHELVLADGSRLAATASDGSTWLDGTAPPSENYGTGTDDPAPPLDPAVGNRWFVTVTPADTSPPATLVAGSAATVEFVSALAPAEGPVVPASALWTRSDHQVFVTVVADGVETDVQVSVLFESQGSALVRVIGAGALEAGDEVAVSERVGP